MVIERFRKGDPQAIGERFRRAGRMMPEGLVYHSSWLDVDGTRCFQLMEAPDVSLFEAWTRNWDDLMEFEIVPVETSADFWARITSSG